MNVLVVSSQSNFLAEGLKTLTENGLFPHIQGTLKEAVAVSQSIAPSLIILDAVLASGDFAGTCQALHDVSRAPVILVSVERLSEFEAAACFEMGLGTQLLQSVSPTLLLAWAMALTKRQR